MSAARPALIYCLFRCCLLGLVACEAHGRSLSQRPEQITMAELSQRAAHDVCISEVPDYVFGGYTGAFPSPPHADLNAKRAFINRWNNFPFRFVFAHGGSYCPWC